MAALCPRSTLDYRLDAGHAYAMIQQTVQCDARYVSRWKKRFLRVVCHRGRVSLRDASH